MLAPEPGNPTVLRVDEGAVARQDRVHGRRRIARHLVAADELVEVHHGGDDRVGEVPARGLLREQPLGRVLRADLARDIEGEKRVALVK